MHDDIGDSASAAAAAASAAASSEVALREAAGAAVGVAPGWGEEAVVGVAAAEGPQGAAVSPRVDYTKVAAAAIRARTMTRIPFVCRGARSC